MSALLDAKKSDVIFICGRCADDAPVGRWVVGAVGTDCICSWCKANLTQVAYRSDADSPFVGHSGTMVSSPCTALELSRRFIWDVNGYYRSLGVDPHASKEELRRAYQERGSDDPRLTYIAKVLLNDATRLEYDLLQVGQLWFDPLLASVVRERLLEESQGTPDIDDPEARTMRKDLLQREDHPIDLLPGIEHASRSQWGHYCWRIGPRSWLMGRWRAFLAKAITDLGITLRFGLMVGVMRSGEHPFAVADISGGRSIIFLGEDVLATYELACEAVICAAAPSASHIQLH